MKKHHTLSAFVLFSRWLAVVAVAGCTVLADSDETETPLSGNPVHPFVQIPFPPSRDSQSAFQKTQYCFPDEKGNFTSAVEVTMGEESDFVWSQGGGCIFRPIREVWAVLHNQPLMVWDGVDSSTYLLRSDLPAGVTHFYEIKYFVDDIIDVDWTMNWYHSVYDGSREMPLQILVNYKKIRGTRFISYWEGTILLHRVTPDITAITMRDQIRASRTSPQDSAGSIQDVVRKLRTGSPNWGPIEGPSFYYLHY